MLGCANLGLEDSNASQFLVTLAPAAQLAGQHTCFGKVLAGYGVVKEVRPAAARQCCWQRMRLSEACIVATGLVHIFMSQCACGGWQQM
jgi:cyclophilin family peptidyl-prolyl cis-trans isomerase